MKISWLYSEPFDYEYKTYVFMAFYQNALNSFKQYRLYPVKKTTDKIYSETNELKQIIDKIDDDFNESTAVVKKLINLSAPKLKELKEISSEMEQILEEEITIEKYGFEHNYTQEGILFINKQPRNYVLNFKINNIYIQEPVLDNVSIKFVETTPFSLKNYYSRLLDKFSKGNYFPVTYQAEVPTNFPFIQSVVPVLKRKLFLMEKQTK
jgi:hypothetical protein